MCRCSNCTTVIPRLNGTIETLSVENRIRDGIPLLRAIAHPNLAPTAFYILSLLDIQEAAPMSPMSY
jgi:hypothetical protein